MQSISNDWKTLTCGHSDRLSGWLTGELPSRVGICITTIFFGVGLYGASLGLWRSPEMACYVALKLPLVIMFTLTVNGLINGMLAQILGSGLSIRKTFQAILMSFTVFALIVGSLSPIAMWIALEAPSPGSNMGHLTHERLLIFHSLLIAFAGIVATQKLFGILHAFSGSISVAWKTLIAWLAGNLFVGAQVSFILRPLLGHPDLEVKFLREHPFEGNFYETIWSAIAENLNW